VSEEDDILQTVADNPTDVAPRLIYADWLDDRGQRFLARFIRAHCAQSEFLVPAGEFDRRPLAVEVMNLQPQLRPGLLAPFWSVGERLLVGSPTEENMLTVLQKKFSFWVDRGLVEEIEVYGDAALAALVRCLGEIFERTPLRRLGVSPSLMRPPHGGPFDFNHWPGAADCAVRLESIAALLDAPEIARFDSLDFRGLPSGDHLARQLIDRHPNLKPRRLVLDSNLIADPLVNELRERFGKALIMQYNPDNEDIPF